MTMINNSYFGNYLTTKYKDIIKSPTELKQVVQSFFSSFETDWDTLYALLYTKYANCYTSSTAEPFKAKLALTIYSRAKIYFRRKEIMEQLLELSEEQIRQTRQVYNHALNPGDLKDNEGPELLDYVNEQNVSYNETNKMVAYENYLLSLKSYEDQFLGEFKPLFLMVVTPQTNLYYEDEEY